MVMTIGNGLDYQSSNPEQDCPHFTKTLGKGMNSTILSPDMSK